MLCIEENLTYNNSAILQFLHLGGIEFSISS